MTPLSTKKSRVRPSLLKSGAVDVLTLTLPDGIAHLTLTCRVFGDTEVGAWSFDEVFQTRRGTTARAGAGLSVAKREAKSKAMWAAALTTAGNVVTLRVSAEAGVQVDVEYELTTRAATRDESP